MREKSTSSNSNVSRGPFGRLGSARPEGSLYPKAELLPRMLARCTDFAVAAFLPLTTGLAGAVLAGLYLLFADGFFHGQSPGKKLLGIKVIHIPTCQGVDYRESALRNFPFALISLAYLLPAVGNFVFWTLGPAIVVFEAWQVVRDKLGLRMGDLFAYTQVVDSKVPVGQARPLLRAVRDRP